MSFGARRPTLLPPRPYGVRTGVPRPFYGARNAGPGVGAGAGGGALGGVLGALGGTLGCLLCLSAIGALGLFATVVAITAYTKRFLDAYRTNNGANNGSAELQITSILLLASLFYAIVSRMQRN